MAAITASRNEKRRRQVAEELTATLASQMVPFEWMKDRASKRSVSISDSGKVITLHSSKGLEAEYEARLLYVGMTRATDEDRTGHAFRSWPVRPPNFLRPRPVSGCRLNGSHDLTSQRCNVFGRARTPRINNMQQLVALSDKHHAVGAGKGLIS